MKIRISKKVNGLYPKTVADIIRQQASQYQIKSFNAETVDTSKQFYVGEGERFTGIKENGTTASFEVVAEHNIGASNVTHRIGERFTMPAGSYLINIYYYDKFYMTVYKIQTLLPDKEDSLYFNRR